MSNNNSTSCLNSNSTCSTCHTHIFLVFMYSFISIVGFIFNLTALIFFFSHVKSRSQTTVYMTNLAIADTLLILTLPVRIYYHLGYCDLSQWLCDGLGLILKANMYGSIFLLTCICFDRCMAVSFPLSARVRYWRQKAPLICLGIWLLTFGASLPIYFSKRGEVSSEKCFDNLPVYAIQPLVVLLTLLIGFGMPLLIMLICSWGLVRAVQKSTAAQSDLVDSKKIWRMIATSLLIFLISFLPYHAILGLLSLNREKISPSMQTAYSYSLMVACLNTVLDPVAYYFTTETFMKKIDSGVQRMMPSNSQNIELSSRSKEPNNS